MMEYCKTSFCSLQEKVEKCLEDGVRLPMLDLKQLEKENTRLLEQQSQNSLVLISNDAPNDTYQYSFHHSFYAHISL